MRTRRSHRFRIKSLAGWRARYEVTRVGSRRLTSSQSIREPELQNHSANRTVSRRERSSKFSRLISSWKNIFPYKIHCSLFLFSYFNIFIFSREIAEVPENVSEAGSLGGEGPAVDTVVPKLGFGTPCNFQATTLYQYRPSNPQHLTFSKGDLITVQEQQVSIHSILQAVFFVSHSKRK